MNILLISLFISLTAINISDDLQNGLYLQSVGGSGKELVTQDNVEVLIGKQYDAKVIDAELLSQNNSNTIFLLKISLDVPYDQKSRSLKLYCVLNKIPIPNKGVSSRNSKETSYNFYFSGAELCSAAVKLFSVTPILRKHPGHSFETSFTLSKKTFMSDEPIVVTMIIRNIGENKIAIGTMSFPDSHRNDQFIFSAYLNGFQLTDKGKRRLQGGMGGPHYIKPGDSIEKEVDLQNWFDFCRPGRYKITCVFPMPLSFPTLTNLGHCVWYDYAVGDIEFIITYRSKYDQDYIDALIECFNTHYEDWQEYINTPPLPYISNIEPFVECGPYKEMIDLGIPILPALMNKIVEGSKTNWNESQFLLWRAVKEITYVDLRGHNKITESEQDISNKYIKWWSYSKSRYVNKR
jgi:hypothetical protein